MLIEVLISELIQCVSIIFTVFCLVFIDIYVNSFALHQNYYIMCLI